jgi:AbiTii
VARSLIDELLLEAADASAPCAPLLRKALVVAAKLGVDEVPQWINCELSGYYGREEIPSYRIVRGRVKAKLMHRLIDARFDSNDIEQKVSERRLDSSVSDLEALLSSEGVLTIAYPAEAQALLREVFGESHAQFVCVIERARIVSILDQVRNEVLRWAIALDKAGVRGGGLSFSQVEKEKAHGVIVNNAGAVTIGNIGNVSDRSNVAVGPQAQANSAIDSKELQNLLTEIRTHIPSLIGPADERGIELRAAMAELDSAVQSTPVASGKLRQTLHQILGVVGNAGQTVITTGLKLYIEQWMRSHGLGP